MIRERDVHCGPQGLLRAPMLSSWSPWQRKPQRDGQGWEQRVGTQGPVPTWRQASPQPPVASLSAFRDSEWAAHRAQLQQEAGRQALRSTTCPPQGPSLSTGLEGQGTFQCLGPERAEDPDTQEQHAGL